MIFSKMELEEGAVQPKWYYGLAYRTYYPMYTYWYPLGIHLVVGWIRKAHHFWLAKFVIPKCKPSRVDKILIELQVLHAREIEQVKYEKDLAWMKVFNERYEMPEGFENFLSSQLERTG